MAMPSTRAKPDLSLFLSLMYFCIRLYSRKMSSGKRATLKQVDSRGMSALNHYKHEIIIVVFNSASVSTRMNACVITKQASLIGIRTSERGGHAL